ncbi:hypothetical protein BFW01_g527 [Lasiodiplodia theobromae]|nr:hypothetical protein BFW01_g527 [Lasiodiplodia theobromae]
MDSVLGFADAYNDFEQRQRSLTPFPGFTPPQSPEQRFSRYFREVADATPGERAGFISSLLTPVVGRVDPDDKCTTCLDQAACLSRDMDDKHCREQDHHRYETLVAARGGACSCARVEKKQKQQQNGNGRKGDNAEGAPADADTDFQLAPSTIPSRCRGLEKDCDPWWASSGGPPGAPRR